MVGFIDEGATVEQIGSWFSSTPQVGRIPRLARTIEKWGKEDLSRLRLAEKISQQEIVELLEVEGLYGRPVIHLLVINNQTSTLISLLDRVTSQHLLSLFRLKFRGLTALGQALWYNRLLIPPYLVERLGVDGLYNLLCERGEWSEDTQLHAALWWNASINEVLSLLKDETRVHHLLSIKGDEGRSVLSWSMYGRRVESFQSIIRRYTGKQAELLELAAITDNKGNTSFHHAAGRETSNYLTDLIKATCSLTTRRELAKVLSKRNNSGGKKELGGEVKKFHSDNEFIYDWAFDSLANKRYLLFDLPSVLIMYNTADRDDADKEATSLEKCFTDLGFKVKAKSSFTKKELFEAIKDHQGEEASRNGQIVALMSHGCKGCITDRDGTLISLKDIERQMCADSHRDTPKLLILQCCQARNSSDPSSDAGSGNPRSDNSYSPTNADFCALMSTGAGTVSQRNTFIPFLAEAIREARADHGLSQTMFTVKQRFPGTVPEQAPYCLDGLKYDFCIKSILPVYLTIARKTEPETAEGRQQEMERANREQLLEPTPSPSKSYAIEPTPSTSQSYAIEPTPSPSKSNAIEPTPSPSKSYASRGKESGQNIRNGFMRKVTRLLKVKS